MCKKTKECLNIRDKVHMKNILMTRQIYMYIRLITRFEKLQPKLLNFRERTLF